MTEKTSKASEGTPELALLTSELASLRNDFDRQVSLLNQQLDNLFSGADLHSPETQRLVIAHLRTNAVSVINRATSLLAFLTRLEK